MQLLDPVLITLYRLTGDPLTDYYLGTFLLALLTVLVGEFTISLVYRVNRRHLEKLDSRYEDLSRLSTEALKRGDKESYKACNKEGNDAFGQLFFNKFGLSAASLWPIFFALAWMQERFAEIALPLPLIGLEINYFFFFLLCYIAARIFFGRIKRKLPYFKGAHKALLKYERSATGSEGFTDTKGPSAPPVNPAA
jgi:hypothetical protein